MTVPFSLRFGLVLGASLTLALSAGAGLAQSRHHTRAHTPTVTAKRSVTNDVPNALQGFSKNRSRPIRIEADQLEVRNKENVATFKGNVHVTQGDTDMRCDRLIVYYEPPSGGTDGAKAASASSDTQRIRRLEAHGHVVVTQKDQTATGDTGIFNMRTNTITLKGHVGISHGHDVLRGDRLLVDMKTGVSHLYANHGRVQGLFEPSRRQQGRSEPGMSGLPRLH